VLDPGEVEHDAERVWRSGRGYLEAEVLRVGQIDLAAQVRDQDITRRIEGDSAVAHTVGRLRSRA
jgi:hypothetical protein